MCVHVLLPGIEIFLLTSLHLVSLLVVCFVFCLSHLHLSFLSFLFLLHFKSLPSVSLFPLLPCLVIKMVLLSDDFVLESGANSYSLLNNLLFVCGFFSSFILLIYRGIFCL